ncbi:hypothetical protein ACO0K2_17765 [Undibacterium sp. MH2W]|uniref:hypothetical protein n=1 Tax=Undibacterium sp. MH2W TaxID=3413044 RepID=UPI003BF01CAD
MSQAGYSLGKDVTLVIIKPDGSVLNIGKVTKFSSKQDDSTQKIKPLTGGTDHLRFFEGWNGSFDVERQGPDLDQYFAQLESNFYAGIQELPVTLQQTIVEPSGAVSQYQYVDAILQYADAGDWAADKSVSQKLNFMAARRIQQA